MGIRWLSNHVHALCSRSGHHGLFLCLLGHELSGSQALSHDAHFHLSCLTPLCRPIDEDWRLLRHLYCNTESVATRIAAKLGAEKCEDISSIQPSELADYDTLILGAPTWHTGEDKERSGTDWDSVIYDDVPNMDLSGKKVAFLGCGDSMSYGDYFCDAMGELYDQFSTTGATVIGKVPVKEPIECIASKAIQGDVFVGLATDEDNLYDETDGRIEKWTTQLKTEGCA